MKDKNPVISIVAEKGSDYIQHPYLIKTKRMDIEGMYLNTIKVTYDTLTANIILNI